MEFRIAGEQDLPQIMDLWDYCFEKKGDPFFQWYFREYCLQHNVVLGGFDGAGRLCNMLHLNPYQILLRGREETAPYIVGVATDPAARGHHLTRGLLASAFALLRGRGIDYVLLMPIYAGIYQPYGFAFCYEKHGYDMPLGELSSLPEGKGRFVIRRSDRLDKELFANVYAACSAKYNGLAIRTDFQWDKLLATHTLENVQAAVAFDGEGRPDGYMFYKVTDDRMFFVQELLAGTAGARLALLRFAGAHRSAAERFRWLAPADDATHLYLPDASHAGTVRPAMMARCLDVVHVLQEYEVPENCPDLACTIAVEDGLVEGNNVALTLVVDGGALHVLPADTSVPGAAMDIGTFTQLLSGAYGAARLEDAGLLEATDPRVVRALDTLFPPCVNYINEDY